MKRYIPQLLARKQLLGTVARIRIMAFVSQLNIDCISFNIILNFIVLEHSFGEKSTQNNLSFNPIDEKPYCSNEKIIKP